ncbi:hypothetical protein BgiBS90_021697, partial [Biomphalaria glabrata]
IQILRDFGIAESSRATGIDATSHPAEVSQEGQYLQDPNGIREGLAPWPPCSHSSVKSNL